MFSLFNLVTYTILGYVLLYVIVLTYMPSYLYLLTPWKERKEGLENQSGDTTPAALALTIRTNADMVADALLVSKYRPNYESILVDLESAIENGMIKHISDSAQVISDNPSSIASIRRMEEINTMYNCIETINNAMPILDKT